MPLAALRRRNDAFVPPLSYRFVSDGELRALLNGEVAELSVLNRQLPLAV